VKNYIVAYDIFSPKRAYKVRKLVYSHAMGGQKSALEVPLDKKDLTDFIERMEPLLAKDDLVNIVEVEEEAILLGKANALTYNKGVIIL